MDIVVDKNQSIPMYIQIFEQIKRQIIIGELKPGYRLLPERKLATELGVNRSTILNAYNKLKAEGLVESKVGQGTVVTSVYSSEEKAAEKIPSWNQIFNSRMNAYDDSLLKKMFKITGNGNLISFAIGIANSKTSPKLSFDKLNYNNSLQHTPLAGSALLRKIICERLSKSGKICNADEVLLLSGSQQGIDLVARVLIEPGDFVIVEAPSYFLALQSFKAAGARIIEIATDQNGMKIDELIKFVKRYHPKCIYTIPNYHNPSSVCMSLENRKKLLEIAYKYEIIIVEDDAYRGLDYEDESIKSLSALDNNGYVVYLSTFSKRISPGLRLGYMVADKEMISKCTMVRQTVDLHPSTISQWLVEEYLSSGEFDKHVDEIRREYKEKRDKMQAALLKYAPGELNWVKPKGGYYFWCHLPGGVNSSSLIIETIKNGVTVMPGIPFFLSDKGEEFIRLNFTFPKIEEIDKGISIICDAVKMIQKGNSNKEDLNRDIMPIF